LPCESSPSRKYKTGTTTASQSWWRRRESLRRPIKYLKTKDLEAAGVGLPRSSNSRMISRTRRAQSARNDRKPRCGYKTGTADPPASDRCVT
jgi:hypothetical protein